MKREHVDVLIVGAGLSGIGAGYHLQDKCPDKTFTILEAREELGGTWDLFRYPGIRSDSDMYTLGFSFRPWTNPKSIADGPSILQYLKDTAAEFGIDKKIRFKHRVQRASWSSRDAQWTVDVTGPDGEDLRFTCQFFFACAGYYSYEEGYTPDFEGRDEYEGQFVHPQFWTDDIEYEDKRVVVIGSGATAVTLVPSLAEKAAHVTMLQRSPTYIVSAPEQDPVARWLDGKVSKDVAFQITRWKNVVFGILFYQFARRYPERAKDWILGLVQEQVGEHVDVDTHFTPRYDPWDQRVCLVPDSDLWKALREGEVEVVTDHIERLTKTGIRLKSGRELDADLVVSATGLKLQFLGGIDVEVDGVPVDPANCMAYKGMMCSDIPNMALAIGYTNASWTLKCDLTCEYVCRLLNHMDAKGYDICTPRRDPAMEEEPLIDFSSGYVQRAIQAFPKQGLKAPWRVYQNYIFDLFMLRRAPVTDGAMEFTRVTRVADQAEKRPRARA